MRWFILSKAFKCRLQQLYTWIDPMLDYEKRRQIERRMKVLKAMATEVDKREAGEDFSATFIEACFMYINGTEKPRISIRAESRTVPQLALEPCIVRNIRPEKPLLLVDNATFLANLELELGHAPTQEEILIATKNEILLQQKSLQLSA